MAADLKAIYEASTEAEAEFNLELFADKWDTLYPSISKTWRTHWSHVIPLFAFSADIRKVIYTTNAIESVNMTLRKVTRKQRIFPRRVRQFTRSSRLSMRNIAVARGPCLFATGSPRSIALPLNSPTGFLNDQKLFTQRT